MKIQKLVFFALLTLPISFLFSEEPPTKQYRESELRKSIVQVRITAQAPNYYMPWRPKKPHTQMAVGIVVEGQRILALTSYLKNYTLIEVKKFSSYTPSPALPVRVDYESNLSLLSIKDPDFFKDLKPLTFKGSIELMKTVSIVQLDNAGAIQEANGKVNAIDMEKYGMGHTDLPYLNIVSEEKHRGNGELIINGQGAIGLLHNFYVRKNSGKAIPGFIIQRFLEQIDKVNGSPFSHLGFSYRPLTDNATKEYFGLSNSQNGVLITEIIPYSSAEEILEVDDIVTEFGNKAIDSRGYFQHPNFDKQSLAYLSNCGDEFGFSLHSELPLKVIRNKKEYEFKLKLEPFPYKAIKIPYKNYQGKNPDYLIRGGFVFLDLSEFLLKEWGLRWRSKINKKLLYLHDYHKYHKPGEEGKFVILSQVFPDISNNGYHHISMKIVEKVNGRPVHSVRDIDRLFDDSSENFISIEVDNEMDIILDKRNLPVIDKRIQKQFGIKKLKNF
ncbi:MAG: serine protease [Leptospiraceae bacterium]|nr:serine protease [Leptospiraceae bacterium]MCP5502473.1 serine protease [Leptospiraceae bacterium]